MSDTQERNYEVVDDFEFDPSNPPERVVEFVARLAEFNHYVVASDVYAERASGKPRQWRQEFSCLDTVRSDGTPAIYSNTVNITRGDGVTPLGEGSAAHSLGLAWQAATKVLFPPNGINYSPRDPRSKDLVGHVFRFRSKNLKLGVIKATGEALSKRVYLPVEYLGDSSYQFTGEMRVLPPRDGEDQIAPSMPSAPSVDEDTLAAQFAQALDGQTVAGAYDAIVKTPLKLTPELFGMNPLAGLDENNPALINALVERGFLHTNGNGTLVANAEKVAA